MAFQHLLGARLLLQLLVGEVQGHDALLRQFIFLVDLVLIVGKHVTFVLLEVLLLQDRSLHGEHLLGL